MMDYELYEDELDGYNKTCENSLKPNTVKKYERCLKRIRENFAYEDDDDESVQIIDVDVRDILRYIHKESIDPVTKQPKSASLVESYRSALVYYYKEVARVAVPPEIDSGLQKYVKGRKQEIAVLRQRGRYKATEGKDVLIYQQYKALMEGTAGDICKEGRLFAILCWNMTCRGETAVNLNYKSIKWAGDCLRITIERSKTQQAGAERGNMLHIITVNTL